MRIIPAWRIGVDFCPELAKHMRSEGGERWATVALVCQEEGLVVSCRLLRAQESYAMLQPDLQQLHHRCVALSETAQVR